MVVIGTAVLVALCNEAWTAILYLINIPNVATTITNVTIINIAIRVNTITNGLKWPQWPQVEFTVRAIFGSGSLVPHLDISERNSKHRMRLQRLYVGL